MGGRDGLSFPKRFLLFRVVVGSIMMDAVSYHILSLCVQPRDFSNPGDTLDAPPALGSKTYVAAFCYRFSSELVYSLVSMIFLCCGIGSHLLVVYLPLLSML